MTQTAEGLRALVEAVGRFYVRDRELARVQRRMSETLGRGESPAENEIRAYVGVVRRYFSGFEREAQSHLKNVEARLKRVSQEQFNLTAERGVAASRVAATQQVLLTLREIESR